MAREKRCGAPEGDAKARAWIELDREALRHNAETLKALLPPGCELMPALKANAYGHGAVIMGRELNRLGVGAFCVATASEGAELRRGNVKGDILVLGYTAPEQLELLRRCRLTQTVTDLEYARLLDGCGKRLDVHIAVDTGMRRLGERSENVEKIARIFALEHLRVRAVYTHFCACDTNEPAGAAFTRRQAEAFGGVVKGLREMGCDIPKTHTLSSGALLSCPEPSGDYARLGIALYGALSAKEDAAGRPVRLESVLSLKARVAQVKEIRKGEPAGYGLAHTAPRDGRLAVIAIGYADGLPRKLSCGGGRALINGREAPIVGRVCMDQTLVDATDIPDACSGSTAVFIGQSGGLSVTAADMAAWSDTIPNEILSRLGARLERIWS